MKKAITVKKNAAQRSGIRVLFILFALISIGLCIWAAQGIAILLCLLPLIPVAAVLVYYETWSITFSSHEICLRVLFWKRTYKYSDLRCVIRTLSATQHEQIRMVFSDRKSIYFQLMDENSNQAVKRITSHISIQN